MVLIKSYRHKILLHKLFKEGNRRVKKGMSADLTKAIRILNEGGYTCVLCKENRIYTSTEREVKFLLDWQNSGLDFSGFCAADKVVGKAAAFLYVLLGVKEVYAYVMSEAAIDTLTKNNIQIQYDKSVKKIVNRFGTGFCPMEEAVWDIDIPQQAKQAIENKLLQMKK